MRQRLTLLSGLAVAVTVVIASAIAYFAVQSQLRGEVDDSLRVGSRMADRLSNSERFGDGRFQRRLLPAPPGAPGPEEIPLGGPRQSAQIVTASGEVVGMLGQGGGIPSSRTFAEVASGEREATFMDADSGADHLRIYVHPFGEGLAFVSARSVNEVDDVLSQLRLLLVFVVIGGTLLAAFLGRAVANASIAPITELEEGARHVAETSDLTRRIEVSGPEETRSLAAQFNTMLDALERSGSALTASVASQRRLIADTSHELRTPITSLRTNIEVLREVERLQPEERAALLAEVEAELEELGTLIEDVIELARGDEPVASEPEPEPVRLDTLVREVMERVGRHWPKVRFDADIEETRVDGQPDRLARALRNLLDNAAKWSPAGGVVDVSVRPGEIVVRDHGSGVPEDELERIFDRFYRAPGNGDRPGSGLGLAIVRQVAEAHGGTVEAENAEGGGARFTLRLPA